VPLTSAVLNGGEWSKVKVDIRKRWLMLESGSYWHKADARVGNL
jgi:hypothetical protein